MKVLILYRVLKSVLVRDFGPSGGTLKGGNGVEVRRKKVKEEEEGEEEAKGSVLNNILVRTTMSR